MTNYFKDCQTLDEARTLYHQLALIHHPDRGGDTRTMQEINAQYAQVMAYLQFSTERTRQAAAHAQGKKTYADYHDLGDVFETLKRKIEFILNISPAVTIELTGAWIWVHGETRPIKEQLKAEGFRWAPDKKLWYYAGVPTFNRQKNSMDDIRKRYGSAYFNSNKEAAPETLAA